MVPDQVLMLEGIEEVEDVARFVHLRAIVAMCAYGVHKDVGFAADGKVVHVAARDLYLCACLPGAQAPHVHLCGLGGFFIQPPSADVIRPGGVFDLA